MSGITKFGTARTRTGIALVLAAGMALGMAAWPKPALADDAPATTGSQGMQVALTADEAEDTLAQARADLNEALATYDSACSILAEAEKANEVTQGMCEAAMQMVVAAHGSGDDNLLAQAEAWYEEVSDAADRAAKDLADAEEVVRVTQETVTANTDALAIAESAFETAVAQETSALTARIRENLDPQGGTFDDSPVLRRVGRSLYAIDSLPVPMRGGDEFLGWLAQDGRQVAGADGTPSMSVRVSDARALLGLGQAGRGGGALVSDTEIDENTPIVASWKEPPASDEGKPAEGDEGKGDAAEGVQEDTVGTPVAATGSNATTPQREGLARTGDATRGTGFVAALAGGIALLTTGTRRRRR